MAKIKGALTGRDIRILHMLSGGQTYESIGKELLLSTAGVRVAFDKIKVKIGATNIPHAVAIYERTLSYERGLTDGVQMMAERGYRQGDASPWYGTTHGTAAGAAWHRRHGEPVCEECLAAERDRRAERKQIKEARRAENENQ